MDAWLSSCNPAKLVDILRKESFAVQAWTLSRMSPRMVIKVLELWPEGNRAMLLMGMDQVGKSNESWGQHWLALLRRKLHDHADAQTTLPQVLPLLPDSVRESMAEDIQAYQEGY